MFHEANHFSESKLSSVKLTSFSSSFLRRKNVVSSFHQLRSVVRKTTAMLCRKDAENLIGQPTEVLCRFFKNYSVILSCIWI